MRQRISPPLFSYPSHPHFKRIRLRKDDGGEKIKFPSQGVGVGTPERGGREGEMRKRER